MKPVRLGWAIEERRKLTIDHLAEVCGVSSAVFLETMIDRLEADITETGRPSWWPQAEGTLPIPA